MSVVYRALDHQRQIEVALKILGDHLVDDQKAQERFAREAEAVSRLNHPGVIRILGYSGRGVRPSYIVTELIEGPTLKAWVDQHGPPKYPEFGALITHALARALTHAHEAGVVHRDIKPANIMLTGDGQLKLLDFGIARLCSDATALTATGTLLGSPAHMSPEAIDGLPITEKSDIYALGTLLYWLTTGELPFDAPNPSALFRRILDGDYTPPALLAPSLGNGLARIIERSLQKSPDARFESMKAFEDALCAELKGAALSQDDAPRYLSDPEGMAESWREGFRKHLLERGRQDLKAGRIAAASDAANRLLSLNPDDPEAHELCDAAQNSPSAKKPRWALWLTLTISLGLSLIWLLPEPAKPVQTPSSGQSSGEASPSKGPVQPPQGQPPKNQAGAAKAQSKTQAKAQSQAQALEQPRRPSAKVHPGHPRKSSQAKARSEARREAKPPNQAFETAASAAQSPKDAPEASPKPSHPAEPSELSKSDLSLRLGPAWANVSVDGKLVKRYAYRVRLQLHEGEHRLGIEAPHGRYRDRLIVVSKTGAISERYRDGRSIQIPGSELRVLVPHPAETEIPEGWIRFDS